MDEKKYDYFIAVPMSSLAPDEYQAFKEQIRALYKTLHDAGKTAFCAPFNAETASFKSPAEAYLHPKTAIHKSRHFVLLLTGKHYTSALVEWGWADMLGLPMTICVRDPLDIPWMMRAMPETHAERVTLITFDHPSEIAAHLCDRPELVA